MTLLSRFVRWLADGKTQRTTFWILRRVKPVLIFGDKAIVSRHDDVIEVLTRNTDFTIEQINAKKLDALHLHFFLGMDTSPEHDREFQLMQNIARREDMQVIRQLIREKSEECISKISGKGQIELVHDLSLVVPMHFMDKYIGVMDGTVDGATMAAWMRSLFHQSFLNLTNDKAVEQRGTAVSLELKKYLEELISKRKAEIKSGNNTDDTILNRLMRLQQIPGNEWITDDVIRRNISGLMIGAVDTTSKCVVHVIDELLRHPDELVAAVNAAGANDIEKVKQYCWEALRFNPHNQVIERYCLKDTEIGILRGKARKIKAGTTVFAAIMSAMLDEKVFVNPMQFDLNRKTEYLHFGYGMHVCYGRYINAVTIPEITAAALRLKNLRRARGFKGMVEYEGAFPQSMVLEFDNK
ncbi:MAG TPA: cytochrome P450 [Chitinophagales bacterium]|nr:cytochrome P450 [Chitinophagales bacterium]